MTVSAHFDGKVIVPDEPLDLPPNQALIVQIERKGDEAVPSDESAYGGSVSDRTASGGILGGEFGTAVDTLESTEVELFISNVKTTETVVST